MQGSHETSFDEDYDYLHVRYDNQIKKHLAIDEKILLSLMLYKFNKRKKRQERTLLITNKALYNINYSSLLSFFSSSMLIKRRIELNKIHGITISKSSGEFVIHVPSEYDYRYSSNEMRELIIETIAKAFYAVVTDRALVFYLKDCVELTAFTTTEYDMKKAVSRTPKEGGTKLYEHELQKVFEQMSRIKEELNSQTEKVFSKESGALQKVTLNDFNLLKVLGRGSLGKVMLAEKKDTKQIYALKSMRKQEIIGKDQIEHTKTERLILEKSSCPFIINLEYAFQTPEKLFFVMKFMKGGDLFQHLKYKKRFDEHTTKFYAAEIVLALEYLHNMDVVYRDLKPENILMDEDGHICLTDFGTAKILRAGEKTYSFLGTPEYVAPEILGQVGYSMSVDWWSLGALIFELVMGIPPFYNREHNLQQMSWEIKEKEVSFGNKVQITEKMKDIVKKLLVKDPNHRLGSRGVAEIKNHPWFADINWILLGEKRLTPPIKPKISSDTSTDYFDEEFTNQRAVDSAIFHPKTKLISAYADAFNGFDYVPKDP